MSNPREEVERLESEAASLPYGPVKVSLLEKAVQLADTCEDVELAYELRNDLMQSAVFSGRPDIAIVAFSWCQAMLDRFPDRFDVDDFLWRYKWIADDLMEFPDVPLDRIESLHVDMRRRCEEHGVSLYSCYLLRRSLAREIGNRKMAQEAHALFQRQPRDSLSDCLACVANSDCSYYSFLGEWERSAKAAEPVLKRKMTCAEQPHLTLANVLMPLFRLGRLDEAKACQREGYRLVDSQAQFVCQQGQHLRFQSLVGDLVSGTRIIERNLPGALRSVQLNERFEFLIAAHFWALRMLGRGVRSLKLRLPDELPPAAENGSRDIAACGDWFLARAQEIARRFDLRNGSDAYQQKIDEIPQLLALSLD